MKYSLIVPYYRTPDITRLALHSMFHFATGEPEVIVVDNAPSGEESRMLDEFSKIRRLDNATALTGSRANFEALDLGIAAASHDLVGLVHSDTIFLHAGWDAEWFGHLERSNLAALGTFEREANPFRPWRKRVRDTWNHWQHKRRPAVDSPGKPMLHFLLTRKSTLVGLNFNFLRDGHLTPAHLAGLHGGLEVLSLSEMSRFMWHTSNITSLQTGQMNDPVLARNYAEKTRRFLTEPSIRAHFGSVLKRSQGLLATLGPKS